MKSIYNIFKEIKSVKAQLSDKLAEIDADVIHSGEYKLAMREEAREAARARLKEINVEAEGAISKLVKGAQAQDVFDYSDPRLLSAVQFVQANGSALPESAWKQMVHDFDGKPKMLSYLSGLFDSCGAFEAAIAANEAARSARMTESFPQRLSDAIYYATSADPTAEVDFSGYESELAQFEAADAEQGGEGAE